MLQNEPLNEPAAYITFSSFLHYGSLMLKTFSVVKSSASSQSYGFGVLRDADMSRRDSSTCGCVNMCTSVCFVPGGPAAPSRWRKQFEPAKVCREALIQVQEHVLLHQLDNEGQQASCTFWN